MSDGEATEPRPASHGDNYTDWINLEPGVDLKMPEKPVPCVEALAQLASVVDEQGEEIDRLRALLGPRVDAKE